MAHKLGTSAVLIFASVFIAHVTPINKSCKKHYETMFYIE